MHSKQITPCESEIKRLLENERLIRKEASNLLFDNLNNIFIV